MKNLFKVLLFIVVYGFFVIGCSDSGGNYEWVIMYYVDADNDLEEFLLYDLNEMESVDISGRGIKVIALVDRINGYSDADGNWSDTRAFEIGYDASGFNGALSTSEIGKHFPLLWSL